MSCHEKKTRFLKLKPLAGRCMGLLLCFAWTSCYMQEIDALNQKVQTADEKLAKLNGRQDAHEKDLLKLWRATHCANPKVGELIDELEQCDSDQCQDRNIEQALSYGFGEPHVVIRLPLGVNEKQVLKELDPIRNGQLLDKLNAESISSASRVLFLAMAMGRDKDKVDNGQKAIAAARNLKSELYEQYKQIGHTPLIGPFRVTCKERTQLLSAYSKKVPDDGPVGKEPRGNSPQIVIWLFKVDC